jgi:hypothetical protein
MNRVTKVRYEAMPNGYPAAHSVYLFGLMPSQYVYGVLTGDFREAEVLRDEEISLRAICTINNVRTATWFSSTEVVKIREDVDVTHNRRIILEEDFGFIQEENFSLFLDQSRDRARKMLMYQNAWPLCDCHQKPVDLNYYIDTLGSVNMDEKGIVWATFCGVDR